MSERLRESLSALMDDAADDLELARVLRSMEEDGEVSATWSRYHLVSAVLRGAVQRGAEVTAFQPLRDTAEMDADTGAADVSAAPAEVPSGSASARAGEADREGARALPGWMSFAAAATVTLAVVIGFGLPGGEQAGSAVATATEQDPGPVRTDLRALLSASQDVTATALSRTAPRAISSSFARPAPALSEAERQVNAYMLHHAEFSAANAGSGMVPFARYASFEVRH